MKTSRWWKIAVVAAAATIAQASLAAPQEILIGAPISMTGLLAPDGLDQKWSYEQAVADVNAKGGIFIKEANKKLPVRLVIADDQSDPAKVTDAMERLIKIEKANLLLSTHGGDHEHGRALAAEDVQEVLHGHDDVAPHVGAEEVQVVVAVLL